MKTNATRLLPALCLLSSVLCCALGAQPTSSKITAVTVYTDRAIITRSATVDLPAGDTTITLEKFPAALLDASVQVRGRGTASATILDVATAITHTDKVDPATQPRVKQLQDEIRELDKHLRALKDRDTILQQQINLVEKIENAIAAPPGKDTASQPKLDDMPKLMTFSQENRARLATDRQELSEKTAETNEKRSALQKQINEILRGGAPAKSYKTLTVRLNAAKAGSLDLTVDYTVPAAASWTPSYDVRLRADTSEVELAYNGIVRQFTGEDWKNVALTLSTARPALGGGAPKNRPWFVDVFVPRQQAQAPAGVFRHDAPTGAGATNATAYNIVTGNISMLNEGYLRQASQKHTGGVALGYGGALGFDGAYTTAINGSSAPAYYDATTATATVDSTMTSASFKITAPTTILSDNTPQKVAITTAKLTAKLQYESTPAFQETAFLCAYVTNTTDFPLLAGGVNVFLDDAFVATSQLKTVMPSERFQLALGADEGVAIKRRIVNRFAENTGLTGSGRRITYEFLITVTNNKKTDARVVFTEALPISKNEKITVNLLAPAPREVGTPDKPGREVTREEDNILWWRIDLKPGQKREIPFKFTIEHPGDIQVIGTE